MKEKGSFDWRYLIGPLILGGLGLLGAILALSHPPPDFSVTIDPIQGDAMQGEEVTSRVIVTALNGYQGSVHFNASHLPAEIWVRFDPQNLDVMTKGDSLVTIRDAESLQPAEYKIPIQVTGSDGTVHEVTYFLSVHPVFYPTGWIGDYGDITFVENSTEDPHSPPYAVKIIYSAAGSGGNNWAGVYWQYPPRNWGDNAKGHDLRGLQVLRFWARGEKGGEMAEFKVGGIEGQYPDSIRPALSTGKITLADTWQSYTIDLKGKDLSHVISGFVWVTNQGDNPDGCTIYIDDILFQ
jgi:hypothetical protein